jgi:hypothetical protein
MVNEFPGSGINYIAISYCYWSFGNADFGHRL